MACDLQVMAPLLAWRTRRFAPDLLSKSVLDEGCVL